jgi:hypothetical protein
VSSRLAYGEYEVQHGRTVERFIRPDAMLDAPKLQRRFFLECEMGTHTISPQSPDKPGATLNKAARYQKYLKEAFPGEPVPYAKQYPDGFKASVLFLVLSEGRAKSVNAALAVWKAATPNAAAVEAFTFEEATTRLRALAGLAPLKGAARPPSGGERPTRSVASAAPEQVRLIRACLSDLKDALHRARAGLRRAGWKEDDLPSYPKDYGAAVEALGKLAR